MTTATLPRLLTNKQAADLLGVKPDTLALWRSTGRVRIPFVRIGGRIRYRVDEIEKWLSERTES